VCLAYTYADAWNTNTNTDAWDTHTDANAYTYGDTDAYTPPPHAQAATYTASSAVVGMR
jgi:hypothetical protein